MMGHPAARGKDGPPSPSGLVVDGLDVHPTISTPRRGVGRRRWPPPQNPAVADRSFPKAHLPPATPPGGELEAGIGRVKSPSGFSACVGDGLPTFQRPATCENRSRPAMAAARPASAIPSRFVAGSPEAVGQAEPRGRVAEIAYMRGWSRRSFASSSCLPNSLRRREASSP